jgi:hypothetical protein
MREFKQAQGHRNNDIYLFAYAFPTMMGGELKEFMMYCSDNMCCAPSSTAPLSSWTGDYDARSDIIDPEAMFQNEMRAVADLEAEYDVGSCDSSISSTGSMASGREHNRVRVFFDASLASTAAPPLPSSIRTNSVKHKRQQQQQQDDPGDARSEATEKSARCNEALNTTIEYIPVNNEVPPSYYRRDHDDGIKSEGGKVSRRRFKTNLSVLDEHRFDYRVLGTSAKDSSAKPHVLTSSIMDSLQYYLPYTKRGEMFWLKYSMVRDGASMQTMLHKTRSSDYTILAVETLDGEVFGAFVGKPWQIASAYYGSQESCLWRLRGKRTQSNRQSRAAKANFEGDIEVFRFAGQNSNIQLCNTDRLAVGGGSPDDASVLSENLSHVNFTEWGFGLAFGEDLQQGTSSPCITFESPALSTIHQDGSRFEVANLEIWTLTPCSNLADAKWMETGKAMIERCMTI